MRLAAVGSNCIDYYNNIDGGKAFQNLESIGLDYNVDFFDVRCLLSYVQGGYVL